MSRLDDDIALIGRMIDRFAASNPTLCWSGASTSPDDFGVPADMWASEVDGDGCVTWRVMPSTLKEHAVDRLQSDFDIDFPPIFRAYLLARHHCFDQLGSIKHSQVFMFPDVPTRDPLRKIRSTLEGWRVLLPAGLIPFAEFGDGWGPMCFDAGARRSDGDCPVLWLDHEQIIPLGDQKLGQRDLLRQFERPLYASFAELLDDVFNVNAIDA
jgi:hypothetical protein